MPSWRVIALGLCVGTAGFLLANPVIAAELFFETAQEAYPPGARVRVNVLLDTQGEVINAIEGTVSVSPAVIQWVEDGNTNVPFWLERPAANTEGRIPFSGAIPGGVTGDRMPLFSMMLDAPASGDVSLTAPSMRGFLHDGEGTIILVQGKERHIRVTPDAAAPAVPIIDREPPDDFMPVRVKDPLMAGGKRAIIFLAQDKGVGIDRYEVFETVRAITREADVAWQRAESPYVLKDQSQGSFVYLRAIDRVGNIRMVRMDPARDRHWFEDSEIMRTLALGVGVALLLGYILFTYAWANKRFFIDRKKS
ncbi:MAG: hypothetical protein RL141_1106 [Candidatus Parcubacteria bacterium]